MQVLHFDVLSIVMLLRTNAHEHSVFDKQINVGTMWSVKGSIRSFHEMLSIHCLNMIDLVKSVWWTDRGRQLKATEQTHCEVWKVAIVSSSVCGDYGSSNLSAVRLYFATEFLKRLGSQLGAECTSVHSLPSRSFKTRIHSFVCLFWSIETELPGWSCQ